MALTHLSVGLHLHQVLYQYILVISHVQVLLRGLVSVLHMLTPVHIIPLKSQFPVTVQEVNH